MKLYNTASRLIETFEPRQQGKVGLYACGPTVYDYTHLGHIRKYVMDDVLVRVLRELDFEVLFVRNITDVGHLSSDGDTGEDKLEKGAKKYNQSVWDVARRFEEYFVMTMDQMGNVSPDVSCRATEHISEQLAMVQALEKAGHTYVIEGDGVYFDTSTFPEYGQMARLQLDKQQAGARLEVLAGKRQPTDFALWKFERAGENRAMVWPSPWEERSFPGWHIECSAMAMKYLGEQFDIHTGGIDHVPVHHTNEIAQAEAATGKKPFVKYWVHHNFLHVEGEKMSKSLGNFYTLDDVLARGISPMALRLLLLGTHYRSEMNFTWDALKGAQKAWEKLVTKMRDLGKSVQPTLEDKTAWVGSTHWQRFISHLQDDLATPEALAVVWELAKSKDSELSTTQRYTVLSAMLAVLGLVVEKDTKTQSSSIDSSRNLTQANLASVEVLYESLPEAVKVLVDERQEARERKDWPKADELRDKLEASGYRVTDLGSEQHLEKK